MLTKAKAKGSSTESTSQETEFKSSRDLSKVCEALSEPAVVDLLLRLEPLMLSGVPMPFQVLLGGQWMEGLRGRWLSFAEQASSPTSMLSGAATATAAVLLAFPLHSSFPDKIATVSPALKHQISSIILQRSWPARCSDILK